MTDSHLETPASTDAKVEASVQEGRLIDLITGRNIAATPEEVEAVQPFLRQLVDDYGYPKSHIRTRPQWNVKVSPSDRGRGYPVDIAVFSSDTHMDSELDIVVECKKKKRKDGRDQLEDYMRLSRAELGVWFNGNERLFLHKVEAAGRVEFDEIPNIPRYGERLEDVGLYRRDALRPTHSLRSVFRAARNYLAANAVGMTRDEALAAQIINLVFCKIYDERFTESTSTVTLRAGLNEPVRDVAERARALFEKVKDQYDDVFEEADSLTLDDDSIAYVVGELQPYCLIECDRDVVADAFETFIGPSLKGAQGQFFTPRNVVRLATKMARPTMKEKVVDPACGSGGFLVEVLRELWAETEQRGSELAWPSTEISNEQQRVAIRSIRGIDKDAFLSKVAKAYMAVLGDGRGGVFCENSLTPEAWHSKTSDEVRDGSFDVVLTNPPFGKKLKVNDQQVLARYALGHKWSRRGDDFDRTEKLHDGQAPQILFVERCLDLLKPGGRMSVVIPESMLCNPSHRFIIEYILSRARIRAVISMPEELFQPYTHAKTAVVLIERLKGSPASAENYPIFMAVARWCGHDSRGHAIPHDDLPEITERMEKFLDGEELEFDHLGFTVNQKNIQDRVYLPKYYNPELRDRLEDLRNTHDLVTMGSLEDEGLLSVSTGHEVGKLAYGTGSIPFIRTSDIASWEIKNDPKHGLSRDIYDAHADKQNVEVGDILMVRDGTYLVGTCAMVTPLDSQIVFQSHLLKFKSHDHEKLDPYLLLGLLSAPIVKEQIAAKRFTQDIIDTLGSRWRELILPIPRDESVQKEISEAVQETIEGRMAARQSARRAVMKVAPHSSLDPTVAYDFLVIGRT
ncbi:N-6 DNA methylase [Dietzia maris]|uniref:N-6 DNA methylase n=1 Tax=Dietzia maris TaxID=37915 RepID=UPI0022B53262|nr:N-6 DNA methylase [Dietzia maris]MCZ4540442.1 N-6 DNA methylase [Dietzia maris]